MTTLYEQLIAHTSFDEEKSKNSDLVQLGNQWQSYIAKCCLVSGDSVGMQLTLEM